MDLQLGNGIDGVEATRRIRAMENGPQVVILTTYDSDADIEAGAICPNRAGRAPRPPRDR